MAKLLWLVKLDDHPTPRILTDAQYRKYVGQAKGGQTTQERNSGHRWTSETAARAARSKCRGKASGRVLGQRLVNAPRVDRVALRLLYELKPTGPMGIQYSKALQVWTKQTMDGRAICISERTALMHLGHLRKWYRKTEGVPVAKLRPMPSGRTETRAESAKKRRRG